MTLESIKIRLINKSLRSKSAVALLAISAPLLFVSNASAAGKYFNCALETSCEEVKVKDSIFKKRSNYTETKYPVVLAHGLGGFSRMFNSFDYFHGIPQELARGGTQVYATKVSAVHNSEFRGEQLLKQVKLISAISGKNKVNLIGHSQGGIDIRYVAGVAPYKVASVTAVSSPEQGSKTADWALKNITGGTALDGYTADNINLPSKAIMKIMNIIGLGAELGSGVPLKDAREQNGWEAANGLTSGYMANFNRKFPAAMPTSYCGYPTDTKVNDIPYYSFSGVGAITNGFDFIDYAMGLTSLTFAGDPNDGLVASCSSRLGQVLRDDYHMNHADSINQFLGITSWKETNPISVYRAQVNRLKVKEGL